MSYKIAFIGGGSVLWTPRLCSDMLQEPKLRGSSLHLVDVDAEALKLTQAYLEKIDEALASGWRIATSELDDALQDADVVIVSISTGGFEAMHRDYTIPEKYGVFHTVGDTVGPAGISRTLRNVPVFFDIARKMEKLCPKACMVHVTNPLSQLTRAVAKATSIKCVGLCHEYTGIIKMLQNFFKLENRDHLDSLCVGVNHFTIMPALHVRGVEDPLAQLTLENYLKYEAAQDGSFKTGTTDDEVAKLLASSEKTLPYYFNFYLHERLGIFPVSGSNHFCENLPYFCGSDDVLEKYHLHRKGVLPRRPERKAERAQRLRDILARGDFPDEARERSNEMLCDVVVGLCAGEARRVIAALPNIGQIDDVAREAVVETWATCSLSGIHPVASGTLPLQLKGFMEQVIAEQELTVEAALTGDRKLFEQALFASPELHRKDTAEKLADELLSANRDYLPQFFGHDRSQ
jgi:alpha-galactosidase/6-phospho-beta-glucosidase family protein